MSDQLYRQRRHEIFEPPLGDEALWETGADQLIADAQAKSARNDDPTRPLGKRQVPRHTAQRKAEAIRGSGGVVRAALDDGQMVTGSLNGADLSTNRAIISIRPEHLLVNPECDVENIISGVVTEKIYLGDHLRINVTTADKILICKVATRHGAAMNAGDAVSLGWAISDAVILPVGAA